MAAIIIRAITALIQAQNRFEVRTGVENCGELPYTDNVRVLVRHGPLRRDPGNGSEWALGYSTGVQAIFDETTIVQCSSQLLPAWKALYRSGYSWEQNWFEVFTCTSQIRYSFYTASYNITIRETNATSLREFGLPSIWFTDSADSLQEPPISVNASLMRSVAPWLTPPWQLVAGANVQAKVGFARRRFIMSSVLRDIVVNLEPVNIA
ncbi:hypothetical protein BDV93DRAFT_94479 [Ceratobasidium sp. AG-I]|nr:hypothetical protein BDV93DRAFT_94479 [Ceratobasidium sp. AG-I]